MRYDITHFLTQFAASSPGLPALRFAGRTTTFGQLQERVNRLASALHTAGLQPRAEHRLFVLDKNHPATIELTLAAARAGVTCVIGNFRLAADELAWAINDAKAKLVVVGHEFAPIIDTLKCQLPTVERVVVLGGPADGYEALVASGEQVAHPVAHEDDDAFLQLYTSGTTGFPKGALLTHRSVGAHTSVMIDQFRFDDRSVSLVPMPLFHVGGICWALLSLHVGAVAVFTRDPSPANMLKDFVAEGITHTFVVPAILHGFMATPDFASFDLSRLKKVAYGAAPMPLPLLEKCLAAMACDFVQVYGMTEMSGVFCMLQGPEHRDLANRHRLVSAGRITPGTELKVVDPSSGLEVPRGTVGEFWVRGEQRLKAYWAREEDTRNAITADGWLRTGDAGRIDADGFVFLTDRVKDMVITGGENVYPAEVERVLVQLPQVSEVAVYGVPHEKWGETLRAAVVLKPSQALTELEIIAYAKAHLAHYKCPTQVEFLAALPRNATGKVLKKDLRAPHWVGRGRAL
jgi:acyl-CoA synthetase (AMP-forming)/AMP-acid ligase II